MPKSESKITRNTPYKTSRRLGQEEHQGIQKIFARQTTLVLRKATGLQTVLQIRAAYRSSVLMRETFAVRLSKVCAARSFELVRYRHATTQRDLHCHRGDCYRAASEPDDEIILKAAGIEPVDNP
jgi:hypothetical protein